MKKVYSSSIKTTFVWTIATLSLLMVLASCSKDVEVQPIEVGEIHIKYVNANAGSKGQDFYAGDTRLGATTVAYGQASDYFTTTSANTIFLFKEGGTSTVTAPLQGSIPINSYYTFFYAMNLNRENVAGALEDDLTVPAAGKAKVRFFHLNSFMASTVPLAVTVQGTAVVKDNLVFGEVTEYLQVDPGAKFSVASSGLTTPLLIDNANLIAGKIYTIWLGGTTSSNLDSHVIITN
jgi:hypothetical protein